MTHGTMAIIELVETFNINKKRPFGRFFLYMTLILIFAIIIVIAK